MPISSNPVRFASGLSALNWRQRANIRAREKRQQLVADAPPLVRKVKLEQRKRPDPERQHRKPVSRPRAVLGTEPTCPTCFGLRRIFGWPYGSANDCGGCDGAGVLPARATPET